MDSNFWVFLCFGQSNMAGQAPIEEQDLAVSDRFLSMATTDGADRKLGTWRKAVPPLCRADANLGPADWFGRTLLEAVPENVWLLRAVLSHSSTRTGMRLSLPWMTATG